MADFRIHGSGTLVGNLHQSLQLLPIRSMNGRTTTSHSNHHLTTKCDIQLVAQSNLTFSRVASTPLVITRPKSLVVWNIEL